MLKKMIARLWRHDQKPVIDVTRSLSPEMIELVRALARRDAQRAYRAQPEESEG